MTNSALDQIDQFEAARTGNLQWFKQQRAAGTLPDLTVADLNNQCVVEYAAENGHLDIVKYLIEESSQKDATKVYDRYALLSAAADGHLNSVEYVIEESGQDVAATAFDNYATHYAAENGHLDVVKYLIEASNQDVDVTAYSNYTIRYALRYAAKNGHLSVIKYLIEDSDQEVDVTAFDNCALRYAAENGHLNTVKYLIEESGQDVDVTAFDNYALRYAAENGHLDIVKYLIENCPQHTDLPTLSQTLLQTAVEHEHLELVEYLTPICEAAKFIDSAAYKKIRPMLVNLETSNTASVNTTLIANTTHNDIVSKSLSDNVSEISGSSRNSFTDNLQHLAAIPADVLQTLSASVEGLQQLRVYLQKVSSDEVCALVAKNRVLRL